MENKWLVIRKKNSLILELLSIILIVYFSGSVWQVSPNSTIFSYVLLAATLLLLFGAFLNRNLLPQKTNLRYYILLYLLGIFFFTFVANYPKENLNFYISITSMIIFSFCITLFIPWKHFLNGYHFTLLIISIISLIYYVLLNYTNVQLNLTPMLSNNGIMYNQGFLFFSLMDPSRNIGVFWEPGVFSSFLIIGIFFQIVFSKKISKICILIYTLTLLSTKSTAGYVLLLILILIYAYKSNLKFHRIFLTLSLFFVASILILNFEQLRYNILSGSDIFSKLVLLNTENMRIQSILFDIEYFVRSPIVGNGFVNMNYLTKFSGIIYNGESLMQTSTSAYYLSSAGVLGLGYSVFWIYCIFNLRGLSTASKIFSVVVFLSILNKEVHTTIIVSQIILLYFAKIRFKVKDVGNE
ncbi:MAG: hypothetical protein PHP65_06015 [Bacilli bacterium]|nr:hypothetical protein [Bacilli bacterium]